MRHEGFKLRRPCKHCPFRSDETGIRFANRERAEEIEETAYRYGFPCHETAEHIENDEGEGGYYFGAGSQHCAGYTIMQLKEYDQPWPGINNDEELMVWLSERMDFTSPVFECTEDYMKANASKESH